MKKLRVLVLMHEDLIPPDTIEGLSDEQIAPWKAEYDVVAGLEALGHDVRPLGMSDDLGVVRRAIHKWKPHVAFNLLEEFHGVAIYDQHVVSYLELVRQAYTGCNPRGLMIAHDKALSKKILAYHRVSTPRFTVFPRNRAPRRPRRFGFPMLVKSAIEDASLGISEDSIVYDEKRLFDRVKFVHREIESDAMVEEYIEGRELYVGVIGNQRLVTFPVWEMLFTKMPEGMPRIASAEVKWDFRYQKKYGITTRAATDLSPALVERIDRVCKRVYRLLSLTGYARLDLRLTPNGRIYVIEANPNPNLEYGEDFAESAHTAGVSYEALLQRILNLGRRYQAAWRA
jgi:D-alanine-D-alanine ligase